jgi:deoxyribodipyrimidine photolyase-related protein
MRSPQDSTGDATFSTLRLILGDQLNSQHSWFVQDIHTASVLHVMMEVRQETDYVAHHIQKVVGFFAAMRAFAAALRVSGHALRYITLDDPANQHTFARNITALLAEHPTITCFEYQAPDEYRLDEQLRAFAEELAARGIQTRVCDTEHFLSTREEVAELFKGKKTYLLETFYRSMRRKYAILMEGNEPETGQWNYDAENRKKLPRGVNVPPPLVFQHDVSALCAMVERAGVRTIGRINPAAFEWPMSRAESLAVLEFFAQHCLEHFGTYQDAMDTAHWSLFHSRLSFALNLKMISPHEVVERCVAEWQARRGKQNEITYPQIEGFVRQIIGWREYMRGVYWAQMPTYRSLNRFEHTAPLPAWFWTGQTQMNCARHAVGQSLDHAYAHHIQRLMVTGNIALLLGVHPDEVDAWYLGIYIDAIEWVEITNTRGMSQFADGGIVGTKPYVASANYMDKMSNYCADCHYDKSKRHEADPKQRPACPLNSLYWDFYDRHRDTLATNPRIGMMYRTLERMNAHERAATLRQAALYKAQADTL